MQSVQSFFRLLFFNYGAATVIPIILLIICKWELNPYREDDFDTPFIISDIVVIIIGLVVSYLYLKSQYKVARSRRGLREKVLLYRKGLRISWLIKSLIAIYSIVSYFMTGDNKFIYISIFCIAILGLSFPSTRRLIKNLRLPDDEIEIINNPYSAL